MVATLLAGLVTLTDTMTRDEVSAAVMNLPDVSARAVVHVAEAGE